MATLVANKAASGIQPRAIHAGVNSIISVYSATADASAGDVIQMVKVPKGAKVHSVSISGHAGAESQGLSVGDGNSATRYQGTTSASAASVISHNTAGLGYEYTADDTIDVTVDDLTSASIMGAITMVVQYSMDDPS